jgi:hypothetical protein
VNLSLTYQVQGSGATNTKHQADQNSSELQVEQGGSKTPDSKVKSDHAVSDPQADSTLAGVQGDRVDPKPHVNQAGSKTSELQSDHTGSNYHAGTGTCIQDKRAAHDEKDCPNTQDDRGSKEVNTGKRDLVAASTSIKPAPTSPKKAAKHPLISLERYVLIFAFPTTTDFVSLLRLFLRTFNHPGSARSARVPVSCSNPNRT